MDEAEDRYEGSAQQRIDRLVAACDAEMERVKACEQIAEGDEGWEVLRNLCPSTAAVAALRDKLTAERARIRRELLAWIDANSEGNYDGPEDIVSGDLRDAIDRICPEEG